MTHEEPAMPPFGDPNRPAPEPNSLPDFMNRLTMLALEGAGYGLVFVVAGMEVNPITRQESMAFANVGAGPVVASGLLAAIQGRMAKATQG